MMWSYKQYFQDRDHSIYTGYVKDHFETVAFMSDKYMSNNQNMLARLYNCLTKAVTDEVLLPKLL